MSAYCVDLPEDLGLFNVFQATHRKHQSHALFMEIFMGLLSDCI